MTKNKLYVLHSESGLIFITHESADEKKSSSKQFESYQSIIPSQLFYTTSLL